MSFAALRRLRRRTGVPNRQKIVEAQRFLAQELAALDGTSAKGRKKGSTTASAAPVAPELERELEWASSTASRALAGVEPSDADLERFFDALERLYGADLSDPLEPRDLVGRTIGGRYVVEALVGEGSAGVVFRARHVETDAAVALKLLHPSKVLRREIIGELDHPRRFWEELVARFRREAKTAAGVRHPGIVTVFDFGAEGTGFYQAMEFLAGETLKEVIARESPMPAARAVRLVHEAASALDAAHARGIVHRDLKPANIFLCSFDWGEQVKVLDFGIAKMVREAEDEATRLTETGVFLGTYRYASPEQCLGESVTAAADVYALGVTLFEMLAGRPPFDGPSSVLAIRHATAPAPRLEEFRTDLPEGLGAIVDRTLAKQPARRYARAGELARALEPFLQAASRPAPPARRRLPADAFVSPVPPQEQTATRSRLAADSLKPAPQGAMAPGGTPGRDPRAFAEMLVSELLQYFPQQVRDGYITRDIYRRLHDAIDLRWSIHTNRFPNEDTDHFRELLVERLAKGDLSRLGPGLPDGTTQERRRRRLQGAQQKG